MANQRTYEVQGLVLNGVNIGGLAKISFSSRFKKIGAPQATGAFGAQHVNRRALGTDVTVECADVIKGPAALAAAVGNTTFSVKESGSPNYHHRTVPGIVLHGLHIRIPKHDSASLTLLGRMRFPAGASVLADLLKITSINTMPPAATQPIWLYGPHGLSFDEYPVGTPIVTPLHVESIDLTLAFPVLDDSADADVGETAVDLLSPDTLKLNITHRDAKNSATLPAGTISAALLGMAEGNFQVSLFSAAGGAEYGLAIENLAWTGEDEEESGPDYSIFRMSGEAAWKRASDGVDLNLYTNIPHTGAANLFSIAELT